MTIEKLKAAREQLRVIEAKQEALKVARERLFLVNKYVTSGQVWKPQLTLKPSERYVSTEVTIQIPITAGYIQQYTVDLVKRAERELIMAGGVP